MDKKFIGVGSLLVIVLFLVLTPKVNAQMMGYPNQSTVGVNSSSVQDQQKEEQEGKSLLDKLSNKQITCQKLTDSDFEKIGEYFMGQTISNTSQHIFMNNMMKTMMGENGEKQFHIAWGKRGSNCDNNAQFALNMMSRQSFGLSGFIGSLIWFVGLVDLVLFGVLLWKKIR